MCVCVCVYMGEGLGFEGLWGWGGGVVVVVVEIKELEDVSSFTQMQLVCALVPIQEKANPCDVYLVIWCCLWVVCQWCVGWGQC